MELQELLNTIHFKGSVRIYHYEGPNDPNNRDYICNESIEELRWGNREFNKSVDLYQRCLRYANVDYFSLAYRDERLELWIELEKVY